MENEDLIHHELEETQAALSDKLEKLQEKVLGTVEGATGAVTETVQAIKGTVQNTTSAVNETVEAVRDSVKETVSSVKDTVTHTVQGGVDAMKDVMNVPLQVQRHPWLMVGGSFAAGFMLGRIFHPGDFALESPGAEEVAMTPKGHGHARNGGHREKREKAEAPGLLTSITEQIAPELQQLRGLGLAMLAGFVKDALAQALPKEHRPQVNEIFDRITRKLSGEREPHRKHHEEAKSHRRNFGHFDRQ